MEASAACQTALEAWLPASSGLRERIHAIRAAHPAGFSRGTAGTDAGGTGTGANGSSANGSSATDDVTSDGRPKTLARSGSGRRHAISRTEPTQIERLAEAEMHLAELALRRYEILQRAKVKCRAILLWNQCEPNAKPFEQPLHRPHSHRSLPLSIDLPLPRPSLETPSRPDMAGSNGGRIQTASSEGSSLLHRRC